MSNKQIYRQCVLEKKMENGVLIDHAWIPARLAKIGKTLTITTKSKNIQDGWVVKSIGGSREESEIKNQTDAQREFVKKLNKKNHRE